MKHCMPKILKTLITNLLTGHMPVNTIGEFDSA